MFKIKQNDTSPTIQATLKDAAGVVVPVTGATIVFNMRPRGSTDPTISRGAGTVVDGAGGVVAYPWQDGDTAITGTYDAEFEVTYSGGGIETFPNDGWIGVKITDDIA